MEPTENVVAVCKDCLDSKRKDFQKKLSDADLITIDAMIKNGEKVYMKVGFSEEQDKFYNAQADRYFYVNKFTEDYPGNTEHMWIICGDVSFKNRTVCGVLANDPVIVTDLRYEDIVIVRFEDIEDIQTNFYLN